MLRTLARLSIAALLGAAPMAEVWADGAVYAMTNALGNNQVLAFHRAANGNLSLVQTIGTGGGGSGLQLAGVDSLGSAGSIQIDPDHLFLFVVNTESAAENNGAGAYNTDCRQGTITSFRIQSDGSLVFADRVFSGGLFPDSLATARAHHGNGKRQKKQQELLLYVLNAGGPEAPAICNLLPDTANTPNITGFSVDQAGHMIPLDSTQPIDPGPATAASGVSCTAAAAAGFAALTGAPAADFQCGLNPPSFARSAAQVGFTRDGQHLVVAVKGTNTIYVFPVNDDGTAGDQPTIMQSAGPALPTFFGFTFDSNDNLLVTEMFGSSPSIPAGAQGALSSFAISSNGALLPISSHVTDGATAPCCIALEPITGRFAYAANNLSASISSYTLANNGAVTLLAGAAASGSGPNDLAVAVEGATSFLYVIDAGTGTVGAFQINADGSLAAVVGGAGLPAGRSAQGIAAF